MADLPIGRRVPMPMPRPAEADPYEQFTGQMAPMEPYQEFSGQMSPMDGGMAPPQQDPQALIQMLLRMMEQQAQRSR